VGRLVDALKLLLRGSAQKMPNLIIDGRGWFERDEKVDNLRIAGVVFVERGKLFQGLCKRPVRISIMKQLVPA
jgi:hypothetical protein